MKKAIIFIVLVGFFITANNVLAVFSDDLLGPKISPDSKLYFLKVWWEKIVLAFTFNPEKKAEAYKAFAEKKAIEAKQMILVGKPAIAEKLNAVYKSYLNKAKDILNKEIQKAVDKGKETLKQQLEKMVDDIMNKIKEGIKI
ncbi:MAG: DUF5667 domain-containing protein [Patescibacteria group bacterium]